MNVDERLTSGAGSPAALVVQALPDDELALLRSGAALRYITLDMAKLVTGAEGRAQQLVDHPLVQASGRSRRRTTWTMPEALRRELVRDWASGATSTWARVATSDDELESTYALLAGDRTRVEGLKHLEALFNDAINGPTVNVGAAHDLIRLLDEWPVNEHVEARELREELLPRLRRHSRAIRDREATAKYFVRDFERGLTDRLLHDGGPWLLQIHAPGGQGKTMFLKNFLGRRCPASDIPVASIDFDFIDRLGVTTTQPWRLLLTVAHQLNAQLPLSPFGFMLDSYGHLRTAMHAEALSRQGATQTIEGIAITDELVAQAADEVPRKFRTELASAVGHGSVVVALDTVENVLHTDGADLDPVLQALADVRAGSGATGDNGVPGLRVIVSGRFDLDSDRNDPPGSGRPRSLKFHQLLQDRQDRQVVSLQLPPFSDDEARRFLAGRIAGERSQDGDEAVNAAVRRSGGNAMKLVLLAEYIDKNRAVTAAEIESLESVELAYLVTRVVDRISDGLVQWLLRWGALLQILTREAVHQIIWPALEEFIEHWTDYDDPTSDKTPQPAQDVFRWHRPSIEEVRRPGSADAAWRKLLDYAALSSWVSTADIPDAVYFHSEVREPLRNLLRAGGHPAFDDIHRRAFTYWASIVAGAEGPTKSAALRGMVFHSYESSGDDGNDELWNSLFADNVTNRTIRAQLAEELLSVARRLRDSGRPLPSSAVIGRAHLERAEALIHGAITNGLTIDEHALSAHRLGLTDTIRAAEPRRTDFLDAVMDGAHEQFEAAWTNLGSALSCPAPAGEEYLANLELIVGWAGRLTPPSSALDTARMLGREAAGTRFESRAAEPLARGLLAVERWTQALEAARIADRAELVALALLGLGRPDEVLTGPQYPVEVRARAALLHLDAERALQELESEHRQEPSFLLDQAEFLVSGEARALRREYDAARADLSQAASGDDPAIAIEANLLLSRIMAAAGDWELSLSSLGRSLHSLDLVSSVRAMALEAVVSREFDPEHSVRTIHLARDTAVRHCWFQVAPPSAQVDLECARLAVLGATPMLLEDLAVALSRVDGAPARLEAMRWLGEVPVRREFVAPRLANRLRSLTEVKVEESTPALFLLTRAELERVLGAADTARYMLDIVAGFDGDPAAIEFTVEDARHRLGDDTTGWQSYAAFSASPSYQASSDGEERPVVRRISGNRGDPTMVVETDTDDGVYADGGQRERCQVGDPFLADGQFALASEPAAVFEALGCGLVSANVIHRLDRMNRPTLALQIADEVAARWPWELATHHGIPIVSRFGRGVIVRRGRPDHLSEPEIPVSSPEVYIAVLNDDRKDRGRIESLLASRYGESAKAVVGHPLDLMEGGLGRTGSAARIVHLVADPIERRRAPALQLTGGYHVTPERLASAIDRPEPVLLILDLVLHESVTSAAEQLMLANATCWHLAHNSRQISVLCGAFGGVNDRISHLDLLVDGLREHVPLADLAGAIQRHHPESPRDRHPLRDCVSLHTAAFDRRFFLGSG